MFDVKSPFRDVTPNEVIETRIEQPTNLRILLCEKIMLSYSELIGVMTKQN